MGVKHNLKSASCAALLGALKEVRSSKLTLTPRKPKRVAVHRKVPSAAKVQSMPGGSVSETPLAAPPSPHHTW